jgi:hypothetical protein
VGDPRRSLKKMAEDPHAAPEGYRFPFPNQEDSYSYEDYREDCTHFATLGRTGAELRLLANRYFLVHYPPADRAQRCLNLFWSIETFLSRNKGSQTPDGHGQVLRWERGTQAAWKYYSGLRYGDVVTDDIAMAEIAKILLTEET